MVTFPNEPVRLPLMFPLAVICDLVEMNPLELIITAGTACVPPTDNLF